MNKETHQAAINFMSAIHAPGNTSNTRALIPSNSPLTPSRHLQSDQNLPLFSQHAQETPTQSLGDSSLYPVHTNTHRSLVGELLVDQGGLVEFRTRELARAPIIDHRRDDYTITNESFGKVFISVRHVREAQPDGVPEPMDTDEDEMTWGDVMDLD